jgi:hypothetical protein
MGLTLSAADQEALAALDGKLAIVRDRVAQVHRGLQYGFYLWGRGGIAKSHTVESTLAGLGADPRTYNTRLTAPGLFAALRRSPRAVHLIEDVERLASDPDALPLLRAALWCQPGRQRVLTWNTSAGREQFTFHGGIILVANRPLGGTPEQDALRTRIPVLRLDATPEEMAALLRSIAIKGFTRGGLRLEPERALEVADFVIAQCQEVGCPLEARLFDNACRDFLSWSDNSVATHWQDLVRSSVRQCADGLLHKASPESRDERLARERLIALEVCEATSDSQERQRLWHQRTGKAKTALYERWREARAERGQASRPEGTEG